MSEGAWLIVGLGNPGPTYVGNRHNVGAMVLDVLGARVGSSFRSHRARAAVIEGRLGGARVVLAKPSSFMNESGGPVAGLSQFFKVDVGQVIAVHDDLDIPFGELRLKQGGGAGGHNGLRSITRSLGSNDYLRVRVGVGRPPGRMDAADYVLRDFSPAERRDLGVGLEEAADATDLLISKGLERAQLVVHAPR